RSDCDKFCPSKFFIKGFPVQCSLYGYPLGRRISRTYERPESLNVKVSRRCSQPTVTEIHKKPAVISSGIGTPAVAGISNRIRILALCHEFSTYNPSIEPVYRLKYNLPI